MPTTEEALEKQRKRNASLAAEIREAEAAQVNADLETHNENQMARLKAEEARLNAELEAAKSRGKVTSSTLDASKEKLKDVHGRHTPPEPPVGDAADPEGGDK